MKKEKGKAVVLFDAGAIEFSVKSAIIKNTLPAIREDWKRWLENYNAADLKTDEDFKSASEFVSECKRTEEKLEEIREKALKGEVSKVIAEIETMKETTRAKRLEFSRAVEAQKDKNKNEAVSTAVLKVRNEISGFKYKPEDLDIEGEIRTAIKGKSAILKMNEEMESTCARIVSEVKEYSTHCEDIRKEVAEVYKAAGEPGTDSEIDMLVKTYADGAPERAKFILDQKRVAREKDDLERKRKEEEALKAAPPAPAPAQAPSDPPARSALAAAAIPGAPVRTLRFGATFDTTDPDQTISLINSIGGRDVKFQEFPKK